MRGIFSNVRIAFGGQVFCTCLLLLVPLTTAKELSAAKASRPGWAGEFLSNPKPGSDDPVGVIGLSDGGVLTVGWHGLIKRWDPQTDTWQVLSKPSQLEFPRLGFVHLEPIAGPHDTTGRWLFAGGFNDLGKQGLALFDLDNRRWLRRTEPFDARIVPAVVRLRDGRVLMIGGRSPEHGPGKEMGSVIGFDGRRLEAMPALKNGRFGHSATLLPDGRVLVVGGMHLSGRVLDSCEIFDPSAMTWTSAAPTGTARTRHAAILLTDGRVLVAGGVGGDGEALRSAEIFDPVTEVWTPIAPLFFPDSEPTGVGLANGDVLLIPTHEGIAVAWADKAQAWVPAGPYHALPWRARPTVLPNGEVVLFNRFGATRWASKTTLDSATSFFGVRNFTETRLRDGRLLLTGGFRNSGKGKRDLVDADIRAGRWPYSGGLGLSEERYPATDAAEIFDFRTGRFEPTGRMLLPRSNHSAIELDDGRVLVVGGNTGLIDAQRPRSMSTAEIWDPVSGRWAALRNEMPDARYAIQAGKFADGKVLFYAIRPQGDDDDNRNGLATAPFQRVGLFEPGRDTFREIPVPPELPHSEKATILGDGRLLVLASGESFLWDVLSGKTMQGAGIPQGYPERWHTVVTRGGKVLFLEWHPRQFDYSHTPQNSRAFFFDPGPMSWTPLPDLPARHLDGNGVAAVDNGSFLVQSESGYHWFDPETVEWHKAVIPTGRAAPPYWSVDGTMPLLLKAAPEVVYMDPTTRQWTVVSPVRR